MGELLLPLCGKANLLLSRSVLFWLLWRWAVRRHPTKSKEWVHRKYYLDRQGGWQFRGRQKIADMDCHFNLVQIAKMLIKRYVQIKSSSTPFDLRLQTYLANRKQNKEGRNS